MVNRIALVHATPVSIAPAELEFERLWPEAPRHNLLDDSLSPDLDAAGGITPAIMDRFVSLANYCVDCGADAILFTCSAFGAAIDHVKERLAIPVLKPNEAMIEEALASGSRIGLLATAESSIRSMQPEFIRAAADRGLAPKFQTRSVPEAMRALLSGDADSHDWLIVEQARQMTDCDVLVLTQFSMARVRHAIPNVPGRPVFTSPESAVMRLKNHFELRR